MLMKRLLVSARLLAGESNSNCSVKEETGMKEQYHWWIGFLLPNEMSDRER